MIGNIITQDDLFEYVEEALYDDNEIVQFYDKQQHVRTNYEAIGNIVHKIKTHYIKVKLEK